MEKPEKSLAELLSEIEQNNNIVAQEAFHQNFQQNPMIFAKNPNSECTKNGLCKKFIHGKCTKGEHCSFSHDEKKMKPCHHFLNNSCTKGEDCDFSHTKDRMPPCRYLMSYGKCTKEGCPFKHVLKPCRYYDKGFCKKGAQCDLIHVPKKACRNYLYGFCPNGPKCEDHHPKLFIDLDKLFLESMDKSLNVIQCITCSEIGHKKTNCYNFAEIPEILEIYCFKCKTKHMSDKKCPYMDEFNK